MPETLLTVQEIADHLRLKPSWVYEHADELGAYRLGNRLGKYLRFALPRVMERLEAGQIGSILVLQRNGPIQPIENKEQKSSWE